jgi:signal transduction histidine kinase
VGLGAEYRRERNALALRRLPLAMGVLVLFLAGALPVELYHYPARLRPYLLVYGVEILVCVAAYTVARWWRGQALAVAAGWAAAMGLCICAYYPLVGGEATIAAAAIICVVVAMPAMLPFTAAHQLAVAGVAALGLFGIIAWGVPVSLPWPYMAVAFLAVTTVSVIGAHSQSRVRAEAFWREASLRHAHEQLRRALTRAQRAVAMRSRLVADVSHELRTPLNVIVGYADMLLDTAESPATVTDTVSRIRSHAVLLEALLSDLLDLSRLASGRVEPVLEDVDVPALLADVAERTRLLVRDKPVEVVVECTLARCRSDRLRLEQILTNLATNAAKFTAEGTITLAAHSSGDHVVFKVSDTGCGIPPAKHESIFDAFEQVAPASDGASGIGLGLAIVRQLTDLLGGTVTVASEVGAGATFTVTLPEAAAASGPAAGDPPGPSQSTPPERLAS